MEHPGNAGIFSPLTLCRHQGLGTARTLDCWSVFAGFWSGTGRTFFVASHLAQRGYGAACKSPLNSCPVLHPAEKNALHLFGSGERCSASYYTASYLSPTTSIAPTYR